MKNYLVTEIEKEMNRWISSIRVVVEDPIGGMKKLRTASERIRNFSVDKSDQILSVAAGLYNLRVVHRKESYTYATSCVRADLHSFRS